MTDETIRLAGAVAPGAGLLSTSEQRSLGLRLTTSLIAAGCLVISAVVQIAEPEQREVAELVAGVAALLVGVPAISAAWHSLRHPNLHGVTDQLIALAVIAAWADGDLMTAALLPLVMTIGHVLEERSLLGSQEAIRALSRLTQSKARRFVSPGETEEVEARALSGGDLIELRAGDLIPADGVVESGVSSVDTASITGESVPVDVEPGALVFSGSINLDGLLVVRITKVGEETTLGRVIALMQKAEHAKPPVTRLLEQYAQRYLLLVLLLAAGTWFMTGSTLGMLAVLVASCPCALVLAAPATSIAAIAVAGRHGVLVKGAAFLEHLATVDSVVFDKTGTVTVGQLRLVRANPEPGTPCGELIRLAGNLGAASGHPVSRALSSLVQEDERLAVEDVRETRGYGLVGRIGGEVVAPRQSRAFPGTRNPDLSRARARRPNRRCLARRAVSRLGAAGRRGPARSARSDPRSPEARLATPAPDHRRSGERRPSRRRKSRDHRGALRGSSRPKDGLCAGSDRRRLSAVGGWRRHQ